MPGAATSNGPACAAPDPGWLAAARISDAVIATDPAGGVRFLNQAAEALLGLTAGQALGRQVRGLFQIGGAAGGSESLVLEATRQRQPVMVPDGFLRLPNGSLRRVEAYAAPVEGTEGDVQGVVISLRDVAGHDASATHPGEPYGAKQGERETAIHQAYAEFDRRAGERRHALARAATVLRDSSVMLETFAASTPELIFVTDREGAIVMVNPAALQALGMTREEVIGRKDLVLFGKPEDAERIRESDRAILAGGEAVTVELKQQTPAGWRSYLLTKSPLRDDAGRVIGLVGVATDFTERNRAQRELEYLLVAEHQVRGEAERANRAKDDFLAVVSHELRSPLDALKGWSHVLASAGDLDPLLVMRGAEAIKRNVEHQARLIDDLLDTACITSGKLEIERRPVNLVDVVQSALEFSRDSARGKQIEVHFAAGQPTWRVLGDGDRLRQVVINLLSNAIKFTPQGGRIDLALKAGQKLGEKPDEKSDEKRVELSVSDNGIGIEPAFLPHVFNRFSQADSSSIRRYRGLGIGLTLARHLVELHGGSIVAASPGSGHGATFTVRLPLLKDDPAPANEDHQGGN